MNHIHLQMQQAISTGSAHYQPALAAFVIEHGLHTLVETGMGVSTVFLLDALDKMGEGHLTSVDPQPWYAQKIEHPRHTHIKALSSECLWQIDGPYDLFLHDGSHNVYSQTLEYNFAWGMLRNGGWLASDDHTWGGHNAWRNFLNAHGLTATKLGAVEIVQKDGEPVSHGNIASFFASCLGWAEDAERAWLASGGTNTEVFKDY